MSNPEFSKEALLGEYGLTDTEKYWLELKETTGIESPLGLTTPEEAGNKLERLGYDRSTWERIVSDDIGSHEVRGYAVVALGSEVRLAHTLICNIRTIDYLEGRVHNDILVGPTLRDPAMHTIALKRVMEDHPETIAIYTDR